MMKKILWGVGILVILFSVYVVYSLMTHRKHSPPDTVTLRKGSTEIVIDYCRPFKKDRVIFGGIVPYDSYWRTGANEATIVKFSQDIVFDGNPIKAGSYRLYTIPGRDEWKVVLNSELEQWGAFEPDDDQDVLSITLPVKKNASVVEQFTIELNESEEGADLSLAWDEVNITVPIKI